MSMSSGLSSGSDLPEQEWNDVLEPTVLNDKSLREFFEKNVFRVFKENNEEVQLVILRHYKVIDALSEKILEAVTSPSSPAKRRNIEINTPAPSGLANLSKRHSKVYEKKFYIHRPYHQLHVSLQVEVFGKFIDLLKQEYTPEPVYVDTAVEVMFTAARKVDKAKKVNEYQCSLKNVFVDYHIAPKSWSTLGQGQSDISVCQDNSVLVNFVVKQELSSGGSEPVLENLGYFIKFQEHKKGQRAPMFLVAMVGPYYMQVFGAAWNDVHLCMDPLSAPLSLLYVPCDPYNSIVKLARAFHALSTHAKELTQTNSNIGPYFCHKMLCNVKKMHNLNVFSATWNGCQAVLKFTQTYGIDVHKCLADKNLAPKVYYHGKIPGNWHVVIMERVGTDFPCDGNGMTDGIRTSLNETLTVLREKQYVHGDLRPPNIRIVDDTVRVLDFDWAGKEGEARYPLELNNNCTDWHTEVKRGQLIKSKHDSYLIGEIIKKGCSRKTHNSGASSSSSSLEETG